MRWFRAVARWFLRVVRRPPLPHGPIPLALAGGYLIEVGLDEIGDPVLAFDNGLMLSVSYVKGSRVVVYTVLDGNQSVADETSNTRLL